ncbi:MAG: hypothetical protein WAU69_06730 [Solirubrobacteraceae bacterium]
MSLTIIRTERDALYHSLVIDLSAIGDIHTSLQHDDTDTAIRLWRRFEAELRLLNDLGWDRPQQARHFELTMPPTELRPIIERIYWNTVAMLAGEAQEIDETEAAVLRSTTTICPAILARLTEHDNPDDEEEVEQ